MTGPPSRSGDSARRLHAVRERIRIAALRAGRDPDAVELVAISKTHPVEAVLELARAGQRVFGENRVQEALAKIPAVGERWDGPPLTWRLVGHLQRNKVKRALEIFESVESVDSLRLLEEVAKVGRGRGRPVPVLLEINCSGEASKGGFAPGEADTLAERLAGTDGVAVRGLMTVGPLDPDPESARPAFRLLRELRDRIAARSGRELPELSMGMSGDLEIGVEEGATRVRVGTALFGERT
jgi:pyridoxal phosphate enzyme (YggS family)